MRSTSGMSTSQRKQHIKMRNVVIRHLLKQGLTTAQVAKLVGVSERTVRRYSP